MSGDRGPGHGGAAARLARLLLRAYSRPFRERYGAGAEYALLEDHRRAVAAGRLAVVRYWVRTTVTTIGHGVMERLERNRHPNPAPDQPTRLPTKKRPVAETLLRDVVLAIRRLARNPGFTTVATVALALGIGAATAIFSVIDAVLLRPLPYPEPDRVVLVGHRTGTSTLGMPDGGYLYYADHATTLEHIAAYSESSAPIAGTGEPLELGIIRTTPSLFTTMGVTPTIGRALTAADAEPGADPVAVVGHGYWERQLGADTAAIGGEVLPGSSITVVGVLPAGFDFPRPAATIVFGNRFEAPDVYLPMRVDASVARFGNFRFQSIGRLAAGATPEDAQRELDRLMMRAAEVYVGDLAGAGFTPQELREAGYRSRVQTVKDATVGDIGRVLWMLLASVGVLLLIATANVANLFLVRAEGRRDELAVLRALGADRAALVRSVLSESVVLAACGALVGIGLAWAVSGAVASLAPGDVPGLDGVGIDLDVAAFAAALALASAVAFGGVALVRTLRLNATSGVATSARTRTAGPHRRRGQDTLVALQVALALVLLIGSGLLLTTFQNLRRVDPGFEPSGVLTLRLSLGESLVRGAGYDDGPDDAVRSRFMVDLVGRLGDLPRVEAASFTGDLPMDGDDFHDFVAVEGQLPEAYDRTLRTLRVFMGPGYLQTIGARLLSGRELEALEFADQPRSVVVNQAFAEQRWPGQEAVGRRLLQYWGGVDPGKDVWYTVVGVVENIREISLLTPPEPTVYLPTIFLPEGEFGMPVSTFVAVLRTPDRPEALIPSVRDAVWSFHPELPINGVTTLQQLTSDSFENVTFAMILLVIAGSLSAVLGLVGVYGTAAYVVGQRTREFGLRLALGATARQVGKSVLGRAAAVGGVGVAVGLAGAAAAGGILQSLLFGVDSVEPAVSSAVAGGLLLAVVLASVVPALRAASVDPVEAMRVE